jgi:lysozyme
MTTRPRRARSSSGKARAKTLRRASPLQRFAQFTAMAVAAVALASCAVLPTNRYPQKSDAKPHEGVASAQSYAIHGIDVSKWQGTIDWTSVRNAGTQFAFIKATEGGDHLDERFYENWNGAGAAGIPRGAYHFVYWCRPAHEQAEWFKRHIPADPDALPPVLDVEWNNASRTCPQRVPRDVAIEKIRTMLRELEAHTGKRPIIYTDINFHKDILIGEFNDYPYWLRSVAAEPEARYDNRRWTFWQYTTTGRVPGIRGDVDRNVFYGTENQWKIFRTTDCDPRDLRQLQQIGLCGK